MVTCFFGLMPEGGMRLVWFQLMDGYVLLQSHAQRWHETCFWLPCWHATFINRPCPVVAWDMHCFLIASLRVARAGCLFKLHGRSGPLGLATVLLAFYGPWWLAFYGPWWLAGSRLPPLPKVWINFWLFYDI